MAGVSAGNSLRDRRRNLIDQRDLRGIAFCRAYADAVDDWFGELAEEASGGDRRHLALLAVGGYGRRELCPYSDLDVVLVHQRRKDIAAFADAIWYPVWDQGIRLDHSVRRPDEVLEAAAGDLRVALGVLDARLVWGESRVSQPLIERAAGLWRSTLGPRWLPALETQMARRHRDQGEVAFLLEPDLKEARGGLRDAAVLQAIQSFAPRVSEYVDLHALQSPVALLTDVRVELQRAAKRPLDRLVLQEQDHVASVLGFSDADALMSTVSEAGRSIAWVVDDVWRRRESWQATPVRARFGRRGSRRPPHHANKESDVEPGILVAQGEVELAPTAPAKSDPSLSLRIAAVAAERELPIARSSLQRLVEEAPPLPDPWPPAARDGLVRTLLSGRPAVRALEALDQRSLLVRVLPEWSRVRSKPQRNAYHRYTVDRHLLEAAANASALADRVERPDLLVLGAFLHDIGKGSTEDHTELGVQMVGVIARRMGLPEADVEILEDLCRYHLLLPDTATRRDLDDPDTVQTVARAVGNRPMLRMLAALTEADGIATGPSAWGTWKAGLVDDLVERTERLLTGAPPTDAGARLSDLHRRMIGKVRASGMPVITLEPPRVLVAAPDRRGLLASVAGTLALHGLDVRGANATSQDGIAVDAFTVEPGPSGWPSADRLGRDVDAVLGGRLPLAERLAAKAEAYAGRLRPSSARPIVPQVSVDNDASRTATIVEVRALDEIGLLHRVAGTLSDCGLDVTSARVATLGTEVIDAFYVRDPAGHKLTDAASLRRLREAVGGAIYPSTAVAP